MTPGAEDEDDGVLVLDSDSQGDDDGIAASQGFEVSSSPEQPYMIDDESAKPAKPAEPAEPAKQVKEKSWMMEVGIEACAAEHKMPNLKGGLAEGGCMDYTSTSPAKRGSEMPDWARCVCHTMKGIETYLPTGAAIEYEATEQSRSVGIFIGSVKAGYVFQSKKLFQKKPREGEEEPRCAPFLQVVVEDGDAVDGWSVGPAGKNGKMFRTMCDGVMVVDAMVGVPSGQCTSGRPLIFVPGNQLVLRAPRPSITPEVYDPSWSNRASITPEVRLEVWAIAGDDNAWQMCVSCHCKLMLTAEECVMWNMAHSQDGPWATVLNFGHVWADGRTPKGPPVFGNGVKLCLREY